MSVVVSECGWTGAEVAEWSRRSSAGQTGEQLSLLPRLSLLWGQKSDTYNPFFFVKRVLITEIIHFKRTCLGDWFFCCALWSTEQNEGAGASVFTEGGSSGLHRSRKCCDGFEVWNKFWLPVVNLIFFKILLNLHLHWCSKEEVKRN